MRWLGFLAVVLLSPRLFGAVGSQPPSGAGLSQNITYVQVGTDLVATFQNAANDATLVLGPGTFSLTPSNTTGVLPYAPLRLIGKTNLTISGSGFGTKISGGGLPGNYIVLSNCHNVTIRDMLFDGGWSGHTSNGISGYHGCIFLAGTNNFIRLEDLKFQGIDCYSISTMWGGSVLSTVNHFSVLNCQAVNCGTTNANGVIDGGFFNGGANDLLLSGFETYDCVRAVELFTSVNAYTNLLIANGVIRSNLSGVIAVGDMSTVRFANLSIDGGSGYILAGVQAQVGVDLQDGVCNVSVDGIDLRNIKGFAIYLHNNSSILSNIPISNCKIIGCGDAALGGAGIRVEDISGGSVIDSVSVRGCEFRDITGGDAISILGGRNFTIENCSFVDASSSGRNGIWILNGNDSNTNILIRNNRFQNFAASRMDYALKLDSGSMQVSFIDNFVTNMVAGAVLDASGSLTLSGERRSYSLTTNLASIAAGAAAQAFIVAPLARTNWSSQLMVPAEFYNVSGGGDIGVTSFCSNGIVHLRVLNNGAGAFDPPNVRFRVLVQPVEAY